MTIATVVYEVNGNSYNLTYDSSSQTWKATITAPSASSGMNNSGSGPGVPAICDGLGYYPGKITVTDTAGNTTVIQTSDTGQLAENLRLYVKETTKPTCSITSPTNGAYIKTSTPEITFAVSDAGSGVNPAACYIKIDSGSYTAVTPVNGVCTYTPSALADGAHTIECYCVDYDGNESDHATASITVDITPPTLNVTSPADGSITNVASCTVAGTTNDVTSDPVTLTVKLNSGSPVAVTVNNDGTFSTTISLAEGSNTIVIKATDAAGQSTTVTRTVTLDTQAPSISAISATPNPVSVSASFVLEVTVTDA